MENAWDPGSYHRFRGLRLRPALDLLRAVGPLPEGAVIDLGCGSGAAGAALHRLGREVIGVDASAEMLAKAEETGAYDRLIRADIAAWSAEAAPALIFSNAALHWLPDHERLMPRLVRMLAPGGTLAVQMPHQNNAPSHRLWVELAKRHFPGRTPAGRGPGILDAVEYHRMLGKSGQLDLWETEYFQRLEPSDAGHPVRLFTEATYGKPILDALDESEREKLIAAYETSVDRTYPRDEDGAVLFPFRRLFFTCVREG